MATNCKACDDLRTNAPNVLVNGVDATACNSLKNNTGFNPATSTDDCADLEDANDCLVGMMEEELDAYDVCDWKEYMAKFIPNVYTVLKGIICAICGLWTNISKIWCWLNNITKAQDFAVTEKYIEWAPGVHKNTVGTDLALPAITGNAYTGYITGSIQIAQSWKDKYPNSALNHGGALLYEYRVKLDNHNLKRFWPCSMQENNAGNGLHAHMFRFKAGDTTYGYDGYDDTTGSSVVPDGWEYLQVRMTSYDSIPSNGRVSLSGTMAVLMNPNSFKCN